MSSGARVPLFEALIVADQLAQALTPGCLRLEIAGSIRRAKPDVGDIEIVAAPRVHSETMERGFFEQETVAIDELQVLVDLLMLDGTLAMHPTDPKRGPKYSKLIHVDSGLQVDLFSTTLERFGLIWLIRTGPAIYSQWVVTEAKARRHHVVDGELHKGGIGCGALPCPVVPTPEESDVFTALHLHPADPTSRG